MAPKNKYKDLPYEDPPDEPPGKRTDLFENPDDLAPAAPTAATIEDEDPPSEHDVLEELAGSGVESPPEE